MLLGFGIRAQAAAYATGANMMYNYGTPAQTTTAAGSLSAYLPGLQTGTLTPSQQQELYQLLQPGTGQFSYQPTEFYQNMPMMTPVYNSRQAAWYGLMSIITTALLWAVLLLLVFVLFRWLNKNRK